MKSRILLTIASALSIGLAQAAAHNEPVQIDQAARRSRENKEFAIGVAIGMFGPAAAKEMPIPFGDIIAEAAIRGSIIEESARHPIAEVICNSLSFVPTIALVDANHFSGPGALEFFVNFGTPTALAGGSAIVHAVLIDNLMHPLTHNIRKGMRFGYQLRTIKNLLTIERSTDAHTGLVYAGVLGPLVIACKTVYDFWHR